ncbi:hypothetical protein P3S68_031321 [Capsicum galapagoense]
MNSGAAEHREGSSKCYAKGGQPKAFFVGRPDDIKDEAQYWSSAVVCYVLGSNPPLTVTKSYFKRIWGKLGIDKIAQTNKGIFIVRFHARAARDKVIEDGIQMFDRKTTEEIGITSDAMKGIKENGKSKDSIAQVRIHAPSDPKGDANGQGLRIGHVGETPLNG